MEIGKLVKQRRGQRGFTMNALAKRSGVGQSTLSEIESGKRQPTYEIIERIVNGLNMSMVEFFSEEEPELPGYIRDLISSAQKLTPEQVDILNQFIKTMTESSSTQDIYHFAQVAESDPLPYEPGEVLAAHRTDDPTRDLPTAALKNIAAFKEACRREVLEELEMEIKSKRNSKGPA